MERTDNNFQKQQYTELLAPQLLIENQPSQIDQPDLNQCQDDFDNNNQNVIDPFLQLKEKDNIMPLLAIIQKVDLNMLIDGKPLICILCTKFIPLSIIFKNIQVTLKNDQDNRSPLHYAIQADDVKAAAWCMQNNNPNQKDNFDNTPILDAIRLGRKRCFLLCIRNKYYDERAPITAAIYNRSWEMKVLYSQNFQILNVRDDHNRGPIEKAVQYNSFETAEFLTRINPQINIQKLKTITESEGIIRKLKKIQQQQSLLNSFYLPLIKPLLLILVICIGINASFATEHQSYDPYTQTAPIYSFLILIIISFYAILYVLGVSCSNVRFNNKNGMSQILRQPNYPTLEQMCPICFRLTTQDHRQDHCFKCGTCVQKYHSHQFVCINAGNEVIWFMLQIFWLFLSIKLLIEFNLYCSENYLELAKFDGISFLFFLAKFELFVTNSMYLHLAWSTFLIVLSFHQLAIMTVLFSMLATGRTYQQTIQTEKYIHMYKIVKNKEEKYVNKEIKIFQTGFLKGLCIVWQNSMLYFFK